MSTALSKFPFHIEKKIKLVVLDQRFVCVDLLICLFVFKFYKFTSEVINSKRLNSLNSKIQRWDATPNYFIASGPPSLRNNNKNNNINREEWSNIDAIKVNFHHFTDDFST